MRLGATSSSRPEDVSPRSADAEDGNNVPADEAYATAEEVSPITDVPRVPQSTVPLPDEDLIAETRGAPPDAPAEGEDVATPAKVSREEPRPSEELPEGREVTPSTGPPREDPSPQGEERPERRTS